jgi:hypothetical protein
LWPKKGWKQEIRIQRHEEGEAKENAKERDEEVGDEGDKATKCSGKGDERGT